MKYPIYIPSKERAGMCKTVKLFQREKIPFYVIAEQSEKDEYISYVGEDRVVCLQGSNYGTSTNARNLAIDHSLSNGFAKHWQFDDDIANIWEHHLSVKQPTKVVRILERMEALSDSDKRIGIIGMKTANYLKQVSEPLVYNTSLTSAFLINNNSGVRFRGIMYVDMDFQLQLLKKGYTTVKCQNYVFPFETPLKNKGGYYDVYANDIKRMEAINVFFKNNPDIKLEVHRNTQGYLAIKNFGTVWRKYKF